MIIEDHIPGNIMYLAVVILVKRTNRLRFKKKIINVKILKNGSSFPYGKFCASIDMVPVPVTLNLSHID